MGRKKADHLYIKWRSAGEVVRDGVAETRSVGVRNEACRRVVAGFGCLRRLWDVREGYRGTCRGVGEVEMVACEVIERNVKAERRTMGKLHILPFYQDY